MNWESILSPEVKSAAISLLGVLLSALIAKRTSVKTARITANAEIEKLKLELAHREKLLASDVQREAERAKNQDFAEMLRSVTAYRENHDVNHKTQAESAIRQALMSQGGETARHLTSLLTLVSQSDPFSGPDAHALTKILNEITVQPHQ